MYTYGWHLSNVKLYEQACAADIESITLYTALYEVDPDRYHEDFPSPLRNYGLHLAHLQRFEDARRMDERTIALYRPLYETDPESHRTKFVQCLTNYSAVLESLGLVQKRQLVLDEITSISASS